MYVPNMTPNDYDNITNDYNKTTDKFSNNESSIDIIIPILLLTIPCGQSFLCLMSLMTYTIFKPLLNNI